MKIPFGKIAAWLGRQILAAIVNEAADRLARKAQRREGDLALPPAPQSDAV